MGLINQAKIKELRSFFHRQEEGASVPYAALKTNSADGIDAALDKDNPQWPVFGPIHDNSLAEIGFAIADEKLRLSDGLRTITLSIDIPVGMPATIQNTFAAALTLEEDWLRLDSANFTVSKVASTLVFTIVLAGDQDAVAALVFPIKSRHSNYAAIAAFSSNAIGLISSFAECLLLRL